MQAKKKPCDGINCNGALAFIWKNSVEDGVRKKFCQSCWKLNKPAVKPTVRQAIERTRVPIKKVSDKKVQQDKLYSILRKNFLKNNPICAAHSLLNCSPVATTIHHPSGRVGDRYLDDSEFIGLCIQGHTYVELNPEWSKENGFSKSRLAK